MRGHVKPELIEEYRRIKKLHREIEAIRNDILDRDFAGKRDNLPNDRARTNLRVAQVELQAALDEMRDEQ